MQGWRGMSPAQSALVRGLCPAGHRFNGANFPTPEGDCPLCIEPAIAEMLFTFDVKVETDAQDARLPSSAYGTHTQEPPLALLATQG